MPKKKPPGTVSHTVFLPEDLHKKVTTLAKYGEADDLIVECTAEAIEPRWKRWLRQEMSKVAKS